MKDNELLLVFDNGGGITMMIGDEYTHYYNQEAKQAAGDYLEYIKSRSTEGWDGNEPEMKIDPSEEQINNGSYRVMDIEDVNLKVDEMVALMTDGETDEKDFRVSGWENVNDFILELANDGARNM